MGYTAASAAAIRPARSPATLRPSRPIGTMAAAPTTAPVSLCEVNPVPPSQEVTDSTIDHSGGCSAVGRAGPVASENGSMKPLPSASRLAEVS